MPSLATSDVIFAALVALAVTALLLLLARARRKRRAEIERLPEAPKLVQPAPGEATPPQLDEAAREAARRKAEEDEAARAREERAARVKAEAEEARRRAEEAAKAGAAEAERLRKEAELAARKAEYEAKKTEEAREKALRRAEEEERARLLREAEAARKEREAREAEERARAEKARVLAEGGKTLAAGLEKTRGGFVARLNALFGGAKAVDEQVLASLEEVLFTADIGVKTANHLLAFARESLKARELSDPERIKAAMRAEIERILAVDGAGASPVPVAHKPYVIMVVGVNGSGKTTTIGKLAARAVAEGKKVILAAGDTFRAAAVQQLEVWGERAGCSVVKGAEGADPGSVVFAALEKARAEGADLVIADTAGRLHTKVNLMEELKKVKRVMEKVVPGAPHETLLVLDATNGQNAIAQARQFHEAIGVTGIALTKLDGTAKGGVIIGICDELKLPVRYVGIGEKVGDLRPFDPHAFVSALFE